MKTPKMLAYGFTFLLLALTAAAIAPHAAAQGGAQLTIQALPPTIDVPGKAGRLAPETAIAKITYKFKVSIPNTGGAGAAACPTANVLISFTEVKPGDWATVTLSPRSRVVELSPQKTTSDEISTEMSITISRKAKAFQSDTYAVKADASAGGTQGCTYQNAQQARSDASIINDYIPILEYTPQKYIQKTGQNKEVLFPIEVTNFGNAQTKVTTTVQQPNKNKLDAVVPPSVTTLNSELDSKTDVKKSIVIAARTPHSNGYTNTLYSFNAMFAGTATTPGTEIAKDEQQITLSVQVQGVYVPGFDSLGALGALGVGFAMIALARRRLR